MSATQNLFEFHADSVGSPIDALFFERLESFMEKSLADIKAFAERESQPYEEARRYVAEWHAKNLFLPSSSSPSCSESTQPSSPRARLSAIQSVLRDTSRILESLATSSGVQSFLLAVDPFNPSDGGFLGGSLVGREFWRGFRGGGEIGARSFKTHCTTQFRSKDEHTDVASPQMTVPAQLSVPATKIYHAKSLKNELYESVRAALRSTSGVRTAEMKWTNPERLDLYGVRLVGWPEGVPSQNPSSLKVGQNRSVLDALQNGTMRFERLSHDPSTVFQGEGKSAEETSSANDTAEDFSWAYDADAGPSSPIQECIQNSARSATISSCSTIPIAANETPSRSLDEHGESQQETWNLEDHIRVIGNDALYSTDYTWDDELHDSTNAVEVWGSADGESARPRKRLRSEEPLA